jgi:hypothetical protein
MPRSARVADVVPAGSRMRNNEFWKQGAPKTVEKAVYIGAI